MTAKTATSILDKLSVTGFSIVCAWRFLLLFSLVPSALSADPASRPFIYQVILYASLALMYGILIFIACPFTKFLYRNKTKSWKGFNIFFGILASLATFFAIYAPTINDTLGMLSYALVGCTEALLMFPWLQLLGTGSNKMSNPYNFVFNMGIGGCIAFVIANLVAPYNYVTLCLLPFFANLYLAAMSSKKSAQFVHDTENFRLTNVKKTTLENSNFILFGLAFGICQYVLSLAYGSKNDICYIVGSGWPICGVIVSAIIILYISQNMQEKKSAHLIQHISIWLFMAGLMVSFYFIASRDSFAVNIFYVGDITGQALCFAGLNTFDFAFMIFAFTKVPILKNKLGSYIGYNRALLYLSMAIGLLSGASLHFWLGSQIPNHVLAIIAGIVILLTLSTMPIFDWIPLTKAQEAQEAKEASENEKDHSFSANSTNGIEAKDASPNSQSNQNEIPNALSREKRIAKIALDANLSKRESEIFGYLAQGMSAGEIQEKLWISIHTVKTHMSNVYHKLEVHSARELLALIDSMDSNDVYASKPNTTNQDK